MQIRAFVLLAASGFAISFAAACGNSVTNGRIGSNGGSGGDTSGSGNQGAGVTSSNGTGGNGLSCVPSGLLCNALASVCAKCTNPQLQNACNTVVCAKVEDACQADQQTFADSCVGGGVGGVGGGGVGSGGVGGGGTCSSQGPNCQELEALCETCSAEFQPSCNAVVCAANEQACAADQSTFASVCTPDAG